MSPDFPAFTMAIYERGGEAHFRSIDAEMRTARSIGYLSPRDGSVLCATVSMLPAARNFVQNDALKAGAQCAIPIPSPAGDLKIPFALKLIIQLPVGLFPASQISGLD